MGIVSDHLNDADTLVGEDTGKRSNKKDSISLLDKLKATGTIKSKTVAESAFFRPKDIAPTRIPIINVAFNGELTGGLTAGLTMIAGPSRHFKSNLGLVGVHAYMSKHTDSVCIFYDSEFGITPEYLTAHGIDTNRVIHLPILTIEELKFDIVNRLESIDTKDKVVIFIDSIGNLASKKEADDAADAKSVGDMSRAKSIKSLFRIITPHLTIKDIPCIVVNHSYETQEMFSKSVISGGCLLAGTKILMSNGNFKNIEDINTSDFVKTLQGDKEVTHSWNPDTLENGTPECYEIEFEDGYKVVCSDKHKFLINDLWIEANAISVGDDATVF